MKIVSRVRIHLKSLFHEDTKKWLGKTDASRQNATSNISLVLVWQTEQFPSPDRSLLETGVFPFHLLGSLYCL